MLSFGAATSLGTLSITSVEQFILLAGQSQYSHMGRRFQRGGRDFEWSHFLILVGIIVFAVGIAWFVARYLEFREKRNADSPQALFAELCRAHALDWSNQRLLRSLASAHRMSVPALLFVEPERFNLETLGNSFEDRSEQVTALRSKLFATSTEKVDTT
jgi:hypothetical protein